MADTTVLPPLDPTYVANQELRLEQARKNIELRKRYQEAKHKLQINALETIATYPSYFDGIASILTAKIKDLMTELKADPKNIKKISLRDAKDLATAMETVQRGKYAAMRMEDVLGALSAQFEKQGDGEGEPGAGKVIQAPIPIIAKGSSEEIKARYDQKTD
jgi:hypothetical protein